MEWRLRKQPQTVDNDVLLARESLLAFTEYTFPRYLVNWHHALTAKYLDKFIKGEIKYLMINMPPQHGKTELASRRLVPYLLGLNPNEKIVNFTHTDTKAKRTGRQIQRIITGTKYQKLFPTTQLNTKNVVTDSFGNYVRTANNFEIVNYTGFFLSAGIGAGSAGETATTLIIDDPYKNVQDAHSVTIRERVWESYQADLETRQSIIESDLFKILIIQTRWHEDDLSGMLLQTEPHKWTVLKIPAICTEDKHPDDPRKEGEALWSEKMSIETLIEKREKRSSYMFSALYQQNPQPSSGNQFKKQDFRYYDTTYNGQQLYLLKSGAETKTIAHRDLTIFCTMDLAMTLNLKSDFTVICTWGLTQDNDLILIDMLRAKMEGAEHIELVWQVYNKWKPSMIYIESVQYQVSLVQTAAKQGLPALELKAGRQETRHLSILAKFEQNKVYLPTYSTDLHIIEDELLVYPNGAHDDIVTCFSYAGIQAEKVTSLIFAPPKESNVITRKQSLRNLLNKQ